MDLLKGVRSYGGFKFRGSVSPNFQRSLAARLCVGSSKVLKVEERGRGYHHAKLSPCQVVGLGFHPPPGRPGTLSFFVCLLVGLSAVTLLTSEFVSPFSP